jgi:hypothetical protein
MRCCWLPPNFRTFALDLGGESKYSPCSRPIGMGLRLLTGVAVPVPEGVVIMVLVVGQ